MGDKTQILTLLLAARFQNKKAIVLGMLSGIALNHLISAWFGTWLSDFLKGPWLIWITAIGFILIGLWMLIPENDEEEDILGASMKRGAFISTFLVFFLGEMGDKTQIATIFLASQYQSMWWVMLASTLGVMAANVPAVYLGDKFLSKIPTDWIRYLSAACFIILGVITLFFY
ncbi:UPF0016 domain-containing protein [Neisseriaceae bacterium PsAf]|nr:UPF0016 domain-containing protein [Neisseriaceae bacterium PsAf]